MATEKKTKKKKIKSSKKINKTTEKKKTKIEYIQKRDGQIVPFDSQRIFNAIHKAFIAAREKDGEIVKQLTQKIVKKLNVLYSGKIPNVEEIQDLVINTLYEENFKDVADMYLTYKKKREEIREAKYFLLFYNTKLTLTENALRVLEARYLRKDNNGKIIETPQQLFQRVASNIAAAEKIYNPNITDDELMKIEEKFFEQMASLKFLPNSPTIMNAGTVMQQLSACFVLPVEDSMESIFEAVKVTAIIHKAGGGTGYNFSHLRPKDDIIRSTGGTSSGPISFMRVFDVVTDVVKQGGKRRGAMMGILNINHPDILEFIEAKEKEGVLHNFNISVGITDEFMKAVKENKKYSLINPRNDQPVKEFYAREIFDKIATLAWKTGDPGVIFLDRLNDPRGNPMPKLGKIDATNPCGEQPLLPNEPCNLGSIDVNKFVIIEKNKKTIDWKKLQETIHIAVRFLDNVIDMNRYPLPEIEKMAKNNRRIGLGIMGWADLLVSLEIPYNSPKAFKLADELMFFVEKEAHKASINLAKERGVFPNFKHSLYYGTKEKLRNCAVTTIAPTGTIGIIAGCSQGIEPKFALAYVRKSRIGVKGDEWTELIEVDKQFEEIAKKKGFYSEELMKKVAQEGSIQNIKEIPEKWKEIFVTAHDIHYKDHIKMQATFQKHVDNAVSKTINLPNKASVEDIKNAYLLAWELGCKGITVYRDGCKSVQVLTKGVKKEEKTEIITPPNPEIKTDTHIRTEAELKGAHGEDLPPGVCLTCG